MNLVKVGNIIINLDHVVKAEYHPTGKVTPTTLTVYTARGHDNYIGLDAKVLWEYLQGPAADLLAEHQDKQSRDMRWNDFYAAIESKLRTRFKNPDDVQWCMMLARRQEFESPGLDIAEVVEWLIENWVSHEEEQNS